MPLGMNRRIFLRTLAFVPLSPMPITWAAPPQHTVLASKNNRLLQKAIQPIDDNFVAVDGWVIPKQQLTHGNF